MNLRYGQKNQVRQLRFKVHGLAHVSKATRRRHISAKLFLLFGILVWARYDCFYFDADLAASGYNREAVHSLSLLMVHLLLFLAE